MVGSGSGFSELSDSNLVLHTRIRIEIPLKSVAVEYLVTNFKKGSEICKKNYDFLGHFD